MKRTRTPLQPLTPAQQRLAETKYDLAVGLARRAYYRSDRRFDLEDFLSAAHLGLVYAAARYDPTRGSLPGDIPFGGFAAYCVRRSIRLLYRERPHVHAVSFSVLSSREERAFDVPDMREAEEKTIDPAPALRWLEENVKPRQFSVLRMYFLDGHTFQSIADIFGKTKQWASLTVATVRRRMQHVTGLPWVTRRQEGEQKRQALRGELREQIVNMSRAGLRPCEIARETGRKASYVSNVLYHHRKANETAGV